MIILKKLKLKYFSDVFNWIREKKDSLIKIIDFLLLFPIIIAPLVGLYAFLIIFLFILTTVITIKQNNSARIISMNNHEEIITKEEDTVNEPWSFSYNFSKRKTKKKETERKISTCRKIVNLYEKENEKTKNDYDNNPPMGFEDYKNLLKKYAENILILIFNFRNLVRISIMSGSIW
jgi:hypothetical protein